MRPFLLYAVIRLGLWVLIWWLLTLMGVGLMLAGVLAALLAMLISILFLDRLRDAAAMRWKAADERRKTRQDIAEQVDRSARYLVTYDRRIIATFLRQEDAFLLESELADLDRERGDASGTCVVLDRVTGERLGGYMVTNGKMLVFLRDDERDERDGRRRH